MTGQNDIELLLRATEKITNSDDQYFQVESSFIDRDAKIGTASASAIIINLLKTILGTGMLALPYAFNKLGLVSGTLLLISCGYFARHGLLVYSYCGMRAGISRDEGISVLCKMVDKRLGPVVNFALFAMCIGSAIGYLCLIGDLLPTLLPFRIGRNLCNAAVTVFILFPLSFVQNMSRLQYTSIIGLFSIVYVFALSICLLVAKDINWSDVPFVKPDHLQLSSVNSIVFVFTCHQSFLIIKSESKNQSELFIARIVNICICTSAIIYILFTVASCWTFGQSLNANILQNYGSKMYFLIGKWLYIILAITSSPLMTSPARTVLQDQFPDMSFEAATTLITILTLTASMFSSNLNTITEWIGILSGIPICFILPPALEYRLFPEYTWKQRFQSMLMLGFGLFCLLLSFL